MNFLFNYSSFLIKFITIIIFVIFIAKISFFSKHRKNKYKQTIKICFINNEINDMVESIKLLKKKHYKEHLKKLHNSSIYKKSIYVKLKNFFSIKKNRLFSIRPTLYILNFKGDIEANPVSTLRKEITAIILVAKKKDEVLLCLESAGGIVNAYGLAASQLQRLRKHKINLTISIDKIAASGGYMMACVANHIIAAPFAIVGSIGVVGQLPNFNKLLKKNNIDFEQHTSGENKRTLTLFGENTDQSRKKFHEELTVIHNLFKDFVHTMRPNLNIDEISKGDHWFGSTALKLGLIDSITTSDDFMLFKMQNFNLLKIKCINNKKFYNFFLRKVFNSAIKFILSLR